MSDFRSLRVAILGAESSGKSTLAEALARRYQTVWVPEFLREFVVTRQRVPVESEQYLIARTQVEREREADTRAATYLFCDTSPLMTVLYSRSCFGEADAALEALCARHVYDFTLVTAPDFPWVADGIQRESDAVRQRIHQELMADLRQRGIAYTLLAGALESRLEQAAKVLAG